MKRKNVLRTLVGIGLTASIFASTVFAIPLSDEYINGYRKGDVNQDGCLTEEDSQYTLQIYTGNVEVEDYVYNLADMNGDGDVNSRDASIILSMVTDSSNFPKGDLTRDGKVTTKDSELALNISLGKVDLTDIYLEIGDLDNDNQITIKDVRLILDSIKEEDFIKGDLNQDGRFDTNDIDFGYKILGGQVDMNDIYLKLGDLNEDGIFNIVDITFMYQKIEQSTDFKKGDLDRNGAVNANDAAKALDLYKYGNVSESDMKIGDMNDDGVINANDAALILDVYKYGE